MTFSLMQCRTWSKYNREMDKRLHPPLPYKRWPRNHQELQRCNSYFYHSKGIYNTLLFNGIKTETEKNFRKNWKGFLGHRSTTSQFMTISQTFERICARNPKATLLFVDFSKFFLFLTQGEDAENTLSIWSLNRNCYCNYNALWKHKSNECTWCFQ